jgi:diadenosine tetraphosphate (Ap4A) HIT family hydrolase
MEDCVFCQIARGKRTASRIYEDENVMAFLDARPITEGHTLVIPKNHYENIFQISDSELAEVYRIVKKVATAVSKSQKANGVNIVQNNGRAANQVIFHFHVHVIPAYEGHEPKRSNRLLEQNELEQVAVKIRRFV